MEREAMEFDVVIVGAGLGPEILTQSPVPAPGLEAFMVTSAVFPPNTVSQTTWSVPASTPTG